jgi:hypothetical protein
MGIKDSDGSERNGGFKVYDKPIPPRPNVTPPPQKPERSKGMDKKMLFSSSKARGDFVVVIV